MAKKAKKAATVMEELQNYSPPWEDDEPKGPGTDEQVKSLTEQLTKMQAQLDARNREDAYRSFQSAPGLPAPGQKAAEPAKAGLDLKGLPDPINETDKWQGELQARVTNYVESQRQAQIAEQQVQQEQASLVGNLWAGFQKAHPDWAQHEMLVEAAANRVSTSLAGRGVNVVQLMKQQPELYYAELAGMLDKQYPQLKGAKEEEEEAEEGPAQVFGGQPGGKGGLAAETASAQSMEEQNKAWLREMGEFRVKAGLR